MKRFFLLPLLFSSIWMSGCSGSDQPTTPETLNAMDHFPEFDVQGHRGARGLLPENTIPSLLKALEFSVTTLEFDLVVSADSKMVISHEPWFHHHISTTPEGEPVTIDQATSHNIFKMTYEEVKRYDVGIRGNERFPDQQPMPAVKPLLKDAIAAVEEHIKEYDLEPVLYNIETKSQPDWYDTFVPQPDVFAQLLYDELSQLGIIDRVFIQSFDVATLQAMREIDANVPLVLLVYNEDGLDENLSNLGFIPDIYSPYFQLVDEELVNRVHEMGMKIVPWTINEVDDMTRIIETGVDGIITDYPDRAQQFLR